MSRSLIVVPKVAVPRNLVIADLLSPSRKRHSLHSSVTSATPGPLVDELAHPGLAVITRGGHACPVQKLRALAYRDDSPIVTSLQVGTRSARSTAEFAYFKHFRCCFQALVQARLLAFRVAILSVVTLGVATLCFATLSANALSATCTVAAVRNVLRHCMDHRWTETSLGFSTAFLSWSRLD